MTHRINRQSLHNSSYFTISETINSATMLMTLIIGLIAGPAVSL